ncbi:MAG: HAMP domain-containing histidine kinase [Chloroflexi bacterium]|nr:HAMP domain-containing histidine kinase [Ardenticatenaceae bacterium]MBL1131376.1 sensor histidine kinase [Chloroflexota bacterium]NOG37480.1 HAMP domain-containing histidine kinase [Chloroflexota bacterium]
MNEMSVSPFDARKILLAAQVTTVLNHIHRIAYALVAADLTVLHASHNFLAVVNEPTTPIVGQKITDLLWEFQGAEAGLRAVLDGSLPFFAFGRVHRQQSDSALVYLDMTVTPVHSAELGHTLLLIAEDVTEQAQMEQRLVQSRNELLLVKEQLSTANVELERLNWLKSLFLSIAAHDLRTPLSTIRLYGELLAHLSAMADPEKMADYGRVIQQQIIRMEALIDDFLDLDAIEQASLKLKLAPVEFNQQVSQVVALVGHLAEKRKQSLTLQLAPAPIPVQLDTRRFQQIVINLLTNATKYTPEGGQIVVYTAVQEDTAVLQISDNGPGMSLEEQTLAFDLYFRANLADEMDRQGRGLGLYIVKMLAEAHHGRVELSSAPGQGCTVQVSLPLLETKA